MDSPLHFLYLNTKKITQCLEKPAGETNNGSKLHSLEKKIFAPFFWINKIIAGIRF